MDPDPRIHLSVILDPDPRLHVWKRTRGPFKGQNMSQKVLRQHTKMAFCQKLPKSLFYCLGWYVYVLQYRKVLKTFRCRPEVGIYKRKQEFRNKISTKKAIKKTRKKRKKKRYRPRKRSHFPSIGSDDPSPPLVSKM